MERVRLGHDELMAEPRFWYGVFAGEFGEVADLDADILERAFRVSDEDAIAWWNRFTGWYEGVLDESDGYVDDPGRVQFLLLDGVRVEIDHHPGGTFHALVADAGRSLIGEIGPHSRLPGLRWREVLEIAHRSAEAGAGNPDWCLLALLPMVWPEHAAELATMSIDIRRALIVSLGVPESAAADLAAAWQEGADASMTTWIETATGPRSESPHSTRSLVADPQEAERITSLIRRGIRE